MTIEDLHGFVRSHVGAIYATARGKEFTARIDGGHLVFTPSSTGKDRIASNRARLQRILEIYDETSSTRTADYRETGSRSLSYILALLEAARGQ